MALLVDVSQCSQEAKELHPDARFFIGVTLLACGFRALTDENTQEAALRAMIVNDGDKPYSYWLETMRLWRGVKVNGNDEAPLAWYARLLQRIAPNAINSAAAVEASIGAVRKWAEYQDFGGDGDDP